MPKLRPARADDHGLYLRLFPELGVDDPPADEARWSGELAEDAYVLEEGAERGRAVGYVLVQILDGVGYVRHVVIDPACRGRGLGGAAMRGIAAIFRDAGCAAWCLNVKPDNEPAVRLYRACGMAEQYRSVSVRCWWSLLDDDDLPRDLEGLDPVRCGPAMEEALPAIEERFTLPGGLLATFAAKERVALLVARRQDRIVGVASFDPVFPGCFPFRADDLRVAVALLEAARPHADPNVEHLQLVVEDAPQLVVDLERVGAVRVLELAHFRGALAVGGGEGA